MLNHKGFRLYIASVGIGLALSISIIISVDDWLVSALDIQEVNLGDDNDLESGFNQAKTIPSQSEKPQAAPQPIAAPDVMQSPGSPITGANDNDDTSIESNQYVDQASSFEVSSKENSIQIQDYGYVTLRGSVTDPNILNRIDRNTDKYAEVFRMDVDVLEMSRLTPGSTLTLPNGKGSTFQFTIDKAEEQNKPGMNGIAKRIYLISGKMQNVSKDYGLSMALDVDEEHVIFGYIDSPEGRYRIFTDKTEGKEGYLMKYK